VRTAERVIAQPSLAHNTDRSPRFVDFRNGDFRLGPRSAARNGGHPDGAFADRDGRRNTMGHTGGPFAADAPAPCPVAAGEITRSAP
jgi:hypothetical protein